MATAPKKSPSAQRTKSRREEQIQQQKRNQQILLTVLAVALLVGVVAAIFIATRPPEAKIPDEVKTRYTVFASQNMQGFTEEGYPYIGAANAPSTIEEFGSFSCPHCAEYDDQVFANILDEIQAGRVKFIFMPLPGFGGFNSQPATEAAICIGQQGKFWEMGDTLYSWQSLYGPGANDPARLTVTAQELGVDMDKYNACLSSPTPKQVIEKAAELANKRNVNVTPTIFFNGQQISPALNGATSPSLSELRGLIEANAAQKKS